jgi:hypothetical protein
MREVSAGQLIDIHGRIRWVSAEWARLLVTIVATVGAGLWAVWVWRKQREIDRRQERKRVAALYVNPFLFAAEDLQSRLYNLLEDNGLVPLRRRDPDGRFAEETLFLLARYFAWEQLLLRFTEYGADAGVLNKTRKMRADLASDRPGVDAWCLFRPTQTALGQAVIVWKQGEVGFADTITLVEFEQVLHDGLTSRLGLGGAVESLRSATHIHDLGPVTRSRLSVLQSHLVSLLELIEADLSKDAAGGAFSVSTRTRSKASAD